MVRIAWLRDLNCDILTPVEIFEHKLKIGDYIRDVSFVNRHKNDYGKNYYPYEEDSIAHGPFCVEMVKGFDDEDFESFSYYCNILNNWKGIKHFLLVRESYSNVILANYLDTCDLTSDYRHVQYTDPWGKNYPNYTAFADFIDSERAKAINEKNNIPVEVKNEDIMKHSYILVKFADRWGNFSSQKSYLYELGGNIKSKIHLGSIINITKLYRESNIVDNPYDKKQLRVETIIDLTPDEANKRIEFSTFDTTHIYTIYGVDIIKESFTAEELGIIFWNNSSEGFEIRENGNIYGLRVKSFNEIEDYIKARRDCQKVIDNEAIHITDFNPAEISIALDSPNLNYITLDDKDLDKDSLDSTLASEKKSTFIEKESQNSNEVFIDRMERCIANKDYIVYPGNQNGFSDELKEQFIYIDPCTMEPYPDEATIRKGDSYYRYSRVKTIGIKNDNNKKERKTMKNIFKNFSFGELKTKEIAYSFNGIAFRDSNQNYCVYNVDTNEATNVSDLVIDIPLYSIPVNKDSIKKGDIIKHKSNLFIVKNITTNGIEAIEPMGGVIMTLIPERSIFGFNYYTKVISPFSMIGNTANEANPFGNMLPFMFMNSDNDSDNNDMFKYLMMFSFMGNGNSNINQMLPFMLMSEDKETNPMLMMMLAQNFNSYNTLAPIENKGEDVEELKKNIAEIKTIIEQINNKRDIAEIKTSIKQINDMINDA